MAFPSPLGETGRSPMLPSLFQTSYNPIHVPRLFKVSGISWAHPYCLFSLVAKWKLISVRDQSCTCHESTTSRIGFANSHQGTVHRIARRPSLANQSIHSSDVITACIVNFREKAINGEYSRLRRIGESLLKENTKVQHTSILTIKVLEEILEIKIVLRNSMVCNLFIKAIIILNWIVSFVGQLKGVIYIYIKLSTWV